MTTLVTQVFVEVLATTQTTETRLTQEYIEVLVSERYFYIAPATARAVVVDDASVNISDYVVFARTETVLGLVDVYERTLATAACSTAIGDVLITGEPIFSGAYYGYQVI